jgi:hypothetical protein
MSAVGRFLQNPSQFLQSNILVIAWDGNEQLADRVHDLTFVSKPAADAVARKMGQDLGLYFVVPQQMLAAMPGVTPDGRTFRSYFCPYRQNDTLGATISRDADFMFTATMDGCSLGIGSSGADGSRLIYHSNLAGQARREGDPAQAAAQDATINLLMPGRVDTIWTPLDDLRHAVEDDEQLELPVADLFQGRGHAKPAQVLSAGGEDGALGIGAGDGDRTHDIQLGKLTFYH